jgi:hypothetical protein
MPKNPALSPIPLPPAVEWEREQGWGSEACLAFKLIHPWLKAMGVYLGQQK